MSATSLAPEVALPRRTAAARAYDYLLLARPRIGLMVLVVVALSAAIAGWEATPSLALLHALLGTFLVAASASACNQYLERATDAKMPRTASRPLPAGRLAPREALLAGAAALAIGLAYLLMTLPWQAAAWNAATWLIYVCAYTPLKRRSTLNTPLGAVAGALPVFIGWTATGAPIDARALTLFLIVFLWQFPHFMAIAWIYREQYRRGGLQMLTVVDPTGVRPGVQAVLGALALLPAALAPLMLSPAAGWFAAGAFVLGLGQLGCAAEFFRRRSERSARRLLWASLVYLPLMFVLMTLAAARGV